MMQKRVRARWKKPGVAALAVMLLATVVAAGCSDDPTQGTHLENLVDPTLRTCASTTPVVTGEVEVERPAVDGDTVNVLYHGTLNNGDVFDSSRDNGEEFRVIVGSGGVIPGFDEALRGLQIGQTITACVPPEQAYGAFDLELTFEFPAAHGQGRQVGAQVIVEGHSVTVTEITDEVIRLNGNHELAGLALTFEIELVSFENVPGQLADEG
jgi:peptidylprolyl isomerase